MLTFSSIFAVFILVFLEKNILLDLWILKDLTTSFAFANLKNEYKSSKVNHISFEEGDGAGYDIKLVDKDDNVKYIEVKTTKGKCSTPFYITKTEISAFAKPVILFLQSWNIYNLVKKVRHKP